MRSRRLRTNGFFAFVALAAAWIAVSIAGPGTTASRFVDKETSPTNTFTVGTWGSTFPAECVAAGLAFDAAHTIVLSAGNDTYQAANGGYLIFGLGGNDHIEGGNGKDCIVGGAGDDYLDGGNGDDVIVGGDGKDVIVGGNGKDRLFGNAGDDSIKGGDGNDAIDGGPDSDRCDGQGGTNTVVNCEPLPCPSNVSGGFHHSVPTISLAWTPVAGAASYNVFRADVSGGPYEPVGSSATAAYDDIAIVEGATYYYVVTAVDADGFESVPSKETAVKAALASSPPSPTPFPTATGADAAAGAATASPSPSPTAPATRSKPVATPTPTATPTPEPKRGNERGAGSGAPPAAPSRPAAIYGP